MGFNQLGKGTLVIYIIFSTIYYIKKFNIYIGLFLGYFILFYL